MCICVEKWDFDFSETIHGTATPEGGMHVIETDDDEEEEAGGKGGGKIV